MLGQEREQAIKILHSLTKDDNDYAYRVREPLIFLHGKENLL